MVMWCGAVPQKAGEDKKLEEARAKERKATAAVEVCESTKTKIQSRIDAVNDKSESATAAIEEADAAIAKFRASLTEAQTTLQRLTEEYDRGDTAAGGIRLTKEQQTKLDELMNTAHAEAVCVVFGSVLVRVVPM
jgi:septal ring factor EnvC (AmiA/AmiB activator)